MITVLTQAQWIPSHLCGTCLPQSQDHRRRWCCLWSPSSGLSRMKLRYIGLLGAMKISVKLSQALTLLEKQPGDLTFVANSIFGVAAFFIIPLASVISVMHVDFHTKLCVDVVVGLVFRPGVLADPRAVISNPGPGIIFVFFSDSNPVIRTLRSVWQDGHHIVVLLLVLDDHHVCVMDLAPLSGPSPIHGCVGVVVRPAQCSPNQKAP